MKTLAGRDQRALALADALLLAAEMLGRPSDWAGSRLEIDSRSIAELERACGLASSARHAGALSAAFAAWSAVHEAEAQTNHDRLFDGRLSCPPNETTYIRRDKGVILADIAGFYHAFGFELSESFGEKHDHIRAELQFAAMLLVMSGRERAAGDEDRREIAASALRSFLDDHLLCWCESFAERLETSAELEFHARVATLVKALSEALRAVSGLPESAGRQERNLALDQGTPYECGLAPAPHTRPDPDSPSE